MSDPTPAPAPARTRTYSWEDPALIARAAAEQDGLEFLRAGVDGAGRIAPIGATVGFVLVAVERGEVTFALDPAEHQYNPIGSVHGGVYATVLDSAAGCAVHSTLVRGERYTSLDLSVKFLRGITLESGRVTCTGRVRHAGRRTALAEAELVDGEGRLLATATSSCLVVRPG